MTAESRLNPGRIPAEFINPPPGLRPGRFSQTPAASAHKAAGRRGFFMRPPDMPRAGRVPLLFQEPIQGAKNASIARFDGLGCYQSRSEISGFPERLSRAAFRGDFQNLPASGHAPGKRADKRPLQTGPGAPQKMGSACQPRAAVSAPPRPHENATPKRPRQNAARPGRLWRRLLRVLLLFQEQIQGAKNASIARFDGLGCYQSRSEKTAVRGLPSGERPGRLRQLAHSSASAAQAAHRGHKRHRAAQTA